MDGFKQEMPPPGGFCRVQYERVPLKKFWPGYTKWFVLIGTTAAGWYLYGLNKEKIRYECIEKNSALCAITPLLLAEHDRLRLNMYRKLREEETNLMKNVEGWKVGTYKGEPIYKTLKPDEWYEPHALLDLKAHLSNSDFLWWNYFETRI